MHDIVWTLWGGWWYTPTTDGTGGDGTGPKATGCLKTVTGSTCGMVTPTVTALPGIMTESSGNLVGFSLHGGSPKTAFGTSEIPTMDGDGSDGIGPDPAGCLKTETGSTTHTGTSMVAKHSKKLLLPSFSCLLREPLL